MKELGRCVYCAAEGKLKFGSYTVYTENGPFMPLEVFPGRPIKDISYSANAKITLKLQLQVREFAQVAISKLQTA